MHNTQHSHWSLVFAPPIEQSAMNSSRLSREQTPSGTSPSSLVPRRSRNRSCVSLSYSNGTVPSRLLALTSKSSSPLKLDHSEGRVPVWLVNRRLIIFKLEERLPSSVGSVPDMKLLSRSSSVVRFCSKPNSVGMLPSRFGFCLMLKYSRLDQLPISLGSDPPRPFVPHNRRNVRDGKTVSGSSPSRSVLERSRYWRLFWGPPPPKVENKTSKLPRNWGFSCSSKCSRFSREAMEEGIVP